MDAVHFWGFRERGIQKPRSAPAACGRRLFFLINRKCWAAIVRASSNQRTAMVTMSRNEPRCNGFIAGLTYILNITIQRCKNPMTPVFIASTDFSEKAIMHKIMPMPEVEGGEGVGAIWCKTTHFSHSIYQNERNKIKILLRSEWGCAIIMSVRRILLPSSRLVRSNVLCRNDSI